MADSLKDRLDQIERLEADFLTEVHKVMPRGPMYVIDMFLFGAIQRLMAQSRGFRELIDGQNFPSAAILLRTQIDTAMRLHGLSLLDDAEDELKKLMAGELKFNQLRVRIKSTDQKTERLTDAFLRIQLAIKYPWVDKVYEETSDFVHLSFHHLWAALHNVNEEERTVYFQLSGRDPHRHESAYFECCEAFLDVTKIAFNLIGEIFMVIHQEEIGPTSGP